MNLYPSIPIKESIAVMIEMLSRDDDLPNRTKLILSDIKKLIEHCLDDCYFLWEDQIHSLTDSGPIGLALMVVMAEAFLQHHEANAINEALSLTPPVAPKSFYRYVDDSHARFKSNEEVEKFFEILNNQHQKIRYTMECEDSEKTLNFLDVSVMNRNEKYEFNVYRKKVITNVQVKPTSCHDPKILDGIFIGFVLMQSAMISTSKKNFNS